jgi:hypothetical protein
MTNTDDSGRDAARLALAGIRLFNGLAALFAPAFLARRLGVNPRTQPAMAYPFRMFGIRTILVAGDLMLWGTEHRAHASRVAVIIHLSDTISAVVAGLRRELPARAAITATLISAVNFGLALRALPPTRQVFHSSVSAPSRFGIGPRPADSPLAVEDLLSMSQHELDSTFRGGSAATIPDGDAEGTVLLAAQTLFVPANLVDRLTAQLARWLVWTGKVFDAQRGELLNKVTPLQVRAIKAKVYKAPSWYDGQEAIILDYSKTSFLAQKIRDEIREVAPGLYLGQVYWGSTRILEFALAFPRRVAAPVG